MDLGPTPSNIECNRWKPPSSDVPRIKDFFRLDAEEKRESTTLPHKEVITPYYDEELWEKVTEWQDGMSTAKEASAMSTEVNRKSLSDRSDIFTENKFLYEESNWMVGEAINIRLEDVNKRLQTLATDNKNIDSSVTLLELHGLYKEIDTIQNKHTQHIDSLEEMKVSLEERIPKEVYALQSQLSEDEVSLGNKRSKYKAYLDDKRSKDEVSLGNKSPKYIPMSFEDVIVAKDVSDSYAQINNILKNDKEKIPSLFPPAYAKDVRDSVNSSKEGLIADLKDSFPQMTKDFYENINTLKSEIEVKKDELSSMTKENLTKYDLRHLESHLSEIKRNFLSESYPDHLLLKRRLPKSKRDGLESQLLGGLSESDRHRLEGELSKAEESWIASAMQKRWETHKNSFTEDYTHKFLEYQRYRQVGKIIESLSGEKSDSDSDSSLNAATTEFKKYESFIEKAMNEIGELIENFQLIGRQTLTQQ